jgi:hypothetical protein
VRSCSGDCTFQRKRVKCGPVQTALRRKNLESPLWTLAVPTIYTWPPPYATARLRASLSRGDGPPPCLLESYGRQAQGFGPAFRSVRAGRPQGGRRAEALRPAPQSRLATTRWASAPRLLACLPPCLLESCGRQAAGRDAGRTPSPCGPEPPPRDGPASVGPKALGLPSALRPRAALWRRAEALAQAGRRAKRTGPMLVSWYPC